MIAPRSLVRCALTAALVSFAPVIAVAAPSPKEKAEAKALGESAKTALAARRYADAMASLKRAAAIDPGPEIEIELAQVEAASGKLLDASRRLTAIVAAEGDAPPAPSAARDAAKKASGAIAARVPSVKVVAKGPSGKVSVTIDGAEASAGTDESVDPGEHTILVGAAGFQTVERKVTLAEGAHETVEVTLESADAPDAPSGLSNLGPRLPGIIVTGAGGLAMVIGAVLGGVAFGATSDAKRGCVANTCEDTPARRDQVAKAKLLGNASTGLLVAGSIVAAGGVALIILTPFSKKKDETPKGAHVTPWIGAGQVGLSGAF